MGTIAQLFESGGQSAREGMFSNLVTLSRVDGEVAPAEAEMLARIAQRLSLTPEQAKEIINHPEEYPMIPPAEKQERFERLIQFIQMVFADGIVDPEEARLVRRFGFALGFEEEEVQKYPGEILTKIKNGDSSEAILESMI